ncbi:hypothetical protein KIPB_006731, partial [Kipferlia bialata]|eukprot:g6731.t1
MPKNNPKGAKGAHSATKKGVLRSVAHKHKKNQEVRNRHTKFAAEHQEREEESQAAINQ